MSYWRNERLVLCNYSTRRSIQASPIACEILDYFGDWQLPDALLARLNERSRRKVRRFIDALAKHSMLETSRRRLSAVPGTTSNGWDGWNPEVGFFHGATKDVPYGAGSDLPPGSEPVPTPAAPFKRYRNRPAVDLSPPATGELADVLKARRTWRRFARERLNTNELSTLLGLTFGVQSWFDDPGRGRLALKTSPSGGACHPLEAYVFVFAVQGLASGLYHYDSAAHRLELLRAPARRREVSKYLPQQEWYRDAALLVMMTAVFGRSQSRYPYARAYRAVLLEAGHFCQTFCLVATWLGLAPFCTAALADSVIERDLGIDGVSESIIYVAGVGRRPRDCAWAPYPDDRPVPRVSSAGRLNRA